MVRPWKAGDYIENRQLVRFRVVWMAFCVRDNHEMRRARAPAPSDVIATLGIIKLLLSYSGHNKVASLLRLGPKKVSSTKD